MQEILDIGEEFTKSNKDLTQSIQKKANDYFTDMKNKNIIDEQQKKKLVSYNSICPRINGNPKIHEEGVPLRKKNCWSCIPHNEPSLFSFRHSQTGIQY